MLRKSLSVAAIAALAAVSSSAFGFEMPKLPGSNSAAPAAGGDAVAMQEGVVKNYAAASAQINTAQLELAKAFELKDQIAALEANETALKSGATLDKDASEKVTKTAESANAAIQAQIDAGALLSEEGKKHYASSILPFAAGLAITAKMPADLKAFGDAAKAQISSAGMLEKAKVTSKLGAGMYLASELPGFTGRVMDGFKKIVTYAQSNSIPVPKDATDVLNSLK